MTEQISMDEAVEHIVQIVEDLDADSLADMYKLVCHSNSKLVTLNDGTFNIEVNYDEDIPLAESCTHEDHVLQKMDGQINCSFCDRNLNS